MHKTESGGESKDSDVGGPGAGQESKDPEGSGGNYESVQGDSTKPPGPRS